MGWAKVTISEELISLGIKENELDNWRSDLYVAKNNISEKWVSKYVWKENVTTFVSDIDGRVWYDIPFGYIAEHLKDKNEKAETK